MKVHAINPKLNKVLDKQYSKTERSLAKTFEEWEAEEAAERKTVKGKLKYAWKDYLYYPLYRTGSKIAGIPDEIKYFIQRGRRGWADRDAWGIDHYLSSFMPEILRRMKNEEEGGGNSYPAFSDDPNCNTPKHWDKTIEKMARGFEAARKQTDFEGYTTSKGWKKKFNKLEKERIKGMNLFVKYYSHLWD